MPLLLKLPIGETWLSLIISEEIGVFGIEQYALRFVLDSI